MEANDNAFNISNNEQDVQILWENIVRRDPMQEVFLFSHLEALCSSSSIPGKGGEDSAEHHRHDSYDATVEVITIDDEQVVTIVFGHCATLTFRRRTTCRTRRWPQTSPTVQSVLTALTLAMR